MKKRADGRYQMNLTITGADKKRNVSESDTKKKLFTESTKNSKIG